MSPGTQTVHAFSPPRSRSMRAAMSLAACHLVLAACTALSDFEVHECTSDADCESLTGPLMRCEQSVCREGCSNDSHCSSFDPGTPLCPSPGAACLAPVSDGGECFLTSGYDEALMGSSTGEEMLLVGAFAPSFRTSTWLALQLAADEIASQGGLPTAASGQRPLWLFLCDDRVESMDGALDYLVNRVGVRALLASLEDRALAAALALPSTAGRALFLEPDGTELSSTGERAAELWSLGPRQANAAEPFHAAIARAAAGVVAAGVPAQEVAIATVVSSASEDEALALSVTRDLALGGTGVADLMRQDRFRSFSLPEDPLQRVETLAMLRSFAPDVVVWFAGGHFEGTPPVERIAALAELEADPGQAWHPIHLLGPRNRQSTVLRGVATLSPAFRTRSLGVGVGASADPRAQSALVGRLQDAFPNAQGDRAAFDGVGTTYDAVYILAYALAASHRDGAPLEVDALRGGLLRVTDPMSEPVGVGPGPTGLGKAMERLAAGLPFNTHGTLGAATFDGEQRAAGNVAFYCWNEGGNLLNVARYDEASRAISATTSECGNVALGL